MYSEVLEMSPREDELSWFPVLQRGLRAMKRRAPLTDEQAQLVRIGAFFAAEVARELLACDDLDDFTARLDHVTSRRWFLAARVLLARAVVRLGPPLLSEMDDEFEASRPGAFLVEVLGPGVALEAARAERLLVAYTREMPGLLPVAPDEPFDVDTVRHLAFSITVPAPIRQAVQGSLKAEACLLTVLHMASASPAVATEPWVRAAIARSLAEELGHFLTFVASIPGTSVPEDLVAPVDRLDLAALEAEHRRLERGMVAIYEAAAQHGTPYYPAGEPLLDD